MQDKEYNDTKLSSGNILRIFNVFHDEYSWTQSKKDMIITICNGSDWKINFESGGVYILFNEYSYVISKNQKYKIIKGDSQLHFLIQI